MKNFKKKVRRILIATSLASVLSTGPLDLHNPDNTAPITVSAQAQGSVSATQFIQSAMDLPSVATITHLTQKQLNKVRTDALDTRHLHNQLAHSSRQNSTVVQWEGYLRLKEEAIQEAFSTHGKRFIQQVMNLPSVSAIDKMSYNQISDLQKKIANIRNHYYSLSPSVQVQANITRWEEFLSAKEAAANNRFFINDIDFINDVRQLPSVAAIQKMSVSELSRSIDIMATIRTAYNELPSEIKNHADVVKWEGYLTLKEQAAEDKYFEDSEPTENPEEILHDFNLQLFNEEFLALVNAERNRLGIHSLYYDEGLQLGTDIRAEELLEIGGLRVDDVPHVRPDGSSWIDVFVYYDQSNETSYASGENLSMASYPILREGSLVDYYEDADQTLENFLANTFYNFYSDSLGHYENMIYEHHHGFSVSMSYEMNPESFYNVLSIYNPMIFSAEYPY